MRNSLLIWIYQKVRFFNLFLGPIQEIVGLDHFPTIHFSLYFKFHLYTFDYIFTKTTFKIKIYYTIYISYSSELIITFIYL